MTKKFHERFEIDLGVDEAKRRFVNRVLNFLIDDIRIFACEEYGLNGWGSLERHICSRLGERWSHGCLSLVVKSDFEKCLQAIEALYTHPHYADRANHGITSILQDTEIDIGIRWEKGRFLPSGAPVLDEKLVNDVLGIPLVFTVQGCL